MNRASILCRIAFALAALVCPTLATAHEVPNEVTVLSYLKPEGRTLTFLVRAPMNSLRDIDIPLDSRGFLDLARVETALEHAAQLWIRDFVKIYEDGRLLPEPRLVDARVSLPSDRGFDRGYEAALAHTVGGDLPPETEMYWEQGLLDVAYEYPIASEDSSFSIEPGLSRLGVQVNVGLHYVNPNGPDRTYDVHADVGRIHLDPSLLQAVSRFAEQGFDHVLELSRHLLFILALAIPFRRARSLAVLAGAFFAGHSASVIASTYGLAPNALWFPYLVEALIAGSILFVALENIVGTNLERRWRVTLFFGLAHGFALSAPLGEALQFAGSHVLASILAFDIGAGIGQFAALAVAIGALTLLFRHVVPERIGTVILSALVAHTAWHWTVEQTSLLGQFPWPSLDALAASGALSWLTVLVALAAALWLMSGIVPAWAKEEPAAPAREG